MHSVIRVQPHALGKTTESLPSQNLIVHAFIVHNIHLLKKTTMTVAFGFTANKFITLT